MTFKQSIGNQNWDQVHNSNDAAESFTMFHKKITEVYNDSFPTKIFKIGYKTRNPWLTPAFKLSIKRKNALFIKSKKHPTPENISIYKLYRNKLNSALRHAEKIHYNKRLQSKTNDMKHTWSVSKEIINRKKSNSYPESIIIDGIKVNNTRDIADKFNKYFVNIGQKLKDDIPNTRGSPLTYLGDRIDHTIFLKPVVEEEVNKIIKSFKTSAAGWDMLKCNIVQPISESILGPLTHVLNLSLTQGIFPHELKIAKIIPLYKAGDKYIVSNYRPISILPFFSKIYERVMYDRMLHFIEQKSILCPCQFGFRKQHSTCHAISYLVHKISQGFNDHNYTLGIFLDFSKAFDTVDHTILLQKLEHYGIRGLALNWLTSYLTDRKQCVSINSESSPYENIICGVPQGSILGPLLFLLYINDIMHVSERAYLVLFADDSNLFINGDNLENMILTMNDELEKVLHWLHLNRLSLNIDKSQYMIFSLNKPKIKSVVKINNINVKRVHEAKFLGILIDPKLSWKNHVCHVKRRISKNTGLLNRARRVLDTKSLVSLYNSFIYPYLTYCLEIWGNTFSSVINPLVRAQKKVIRLIASVPRYEHTKPLFQQLDILPLPQLIEFRMIMFLYKYENNKVPCVINNIFTRNREVHTYNTRNANNFIIPPIKVECFRRSFTYNAIITYNKFINHLNFSVYICKFKKLAKILIRSTS